MVGSPAAQVVRLLWVRMTEMGTQVTLCRVSFLQQKFLAPETSSHTGLMARLPLGKSVHPHAHMALCAQLQRNPPMSLKVEFIPRKGQRVCTQIYLPGCGRINKHFPIKDCSSKSWRVSIRGTLCAHEEGMDMKACPTSLGLGTPGPLPPCEG